VGRGKTGNILGQLEEGGEFVRYFLARQEARAASCERPRIGRCSWGLLTLDRAGTNLTCGGSGRRRSLRTQTRGRSNVLAKNAVVTCRHVQ
jgi:hypothetical protein